MTPSSLTPICQTTQRHTPVHDIVKPINIAVGVRQSEREVDYFQERKRTKEESLIFDPTTQKSTTQYLGSEDGPSLPGLR
jgi:hypothetical protein